MVSNIGLLHSTRWACSAAAARHFDPTVCLTPLRGAGATSSSRRHFVPILGTLVQVGSGDIGETLPILTQILAKLI
jgi:hypothetical protein